MEKLLLNRTEAAAYIGIHRHTLRRWEEQEVGLRPQKIGDMGRAFYARKALQELYKIYMILFGKSVVVEVDVSE